MSRGSGRQTCGFSRILRRSCTCIARTVSAASSRLPERFHGVLVSDFFSADDLLPCKQQKLFDPSHRDFNHDIRKSIRRGIEGPRCQTRRLAQGDRNNASTRTVLTQVPLSPQEGCGPVLRVCRLGLSIGGRQGLPESPGEESGEAVHLHRPRRGANENNNAEHAIKKFAYYREIADGMFSEAACRITDFGQRPDLRLQGDRIPSIPAVSGAGHRGIPSQRISCGQGRTLRPLPWGPKPQS